MLFSRNEIEKQFREIFIINIHYRHSISAQLFPHILPVRLNLLLYASIFVYWWHEELFPMSIQSSSRERKTSQVVHDYFRSKNSSQNNLKIFIRLVLPNYLAWVHINWGIRKFKGELKPWGKQMRFFDTSLLLQCSRSNISWRFPSIACKVLHTLQLDGADMNTNFCGY